MEIRLQKWGNSAGIRIPSSILKDLNLKIGGIINIDKCGNKIIITKPEKEKVSLKKLFENYEGENLAKDFEWDEARGKEIW